MKPVFHPTEAAIVRLALGLSPAAADAQLDLWRPDRGVASLLPDQTDQRDLEPAASNALARMILSGYEDTLPAYQWSAGGILFSTRPEVGPKRFAPELLFGINWADSGPGFSWPEVYHLARLPVFDRWVVVASRDTGEVDGYCDRVLAHFADGGDPVTQAASCIEDYWSELRGCDQPCFEAVIATGLIPDVAEMAGRVWEQDDGDEAEEGDGGEDDGDEDDETEWDDDA